MVSEMDYQGYQMALRFDQRISKMAALQPLTLILIDELDPQESDRMLDVGTGTGRLGMLLFDMIPKGFIAGIDSSYGVLKVASEKISGAQIDNFFLVRGKAEALPFLSQSFDSACLMLSFHHFTEPERAVKEVHRALRDKGKLVSLDPVLKEASSEEEETVNKLVEEAFQWAHGPEFRFFTVRELRELYQTAGFSIENCQTHDFTFHQIGVDGIPMGPHWLQAYEWLCSHGEESLIEKFEQNYFAFRQKGSKLLVRGKMSWVTIKAVSS